MELIRREDAIGWMKAVTNVMPGDLDHRQMSTFHTVRVTMLESIGYCKTVDAVEVVHAEWRDIYKGYANHRHECTACKGKALYSLERDVLNRWIEVEQLSAYCPHCGAKMDGGK